MGWAEEGGLGSEGGVGGGVKERGGMGWAEEGGWGSEGGLGGGVKGGGGGVKGRGGMGRGPQRRNFFPCLSLSSFSM